MLKHIFASILSLSFILGVTVNNVIQPAYAEEEVADEEEDNEVEFTSAVITAISCAKEAEESGEFEVLASCPPHKAFEGIQDIYDNPPKIVVFDVTEGEYYYIKPTKDSVYWSDLLEGFGGSIDGSGVIVGEKDGISVVKLEEFEITPKPKPGFFKGCL
ncbi:hypothetical protein SAMN06265182_1444 [Persephonella hydrogeniphila]|uniref:Uncharacterized protein n=1 Tax=Persephonella hydrogeniphila TaxID=198703 RepID=A0A285NHK3_9AQUI|nr:hypothetical protein [Persephonella hydrogeniphila]SNZ08992.1 hypothetical protein SAMN06265182_1444 [Persephonella hydrogeniphila]